MNIPLALSLLQAATSILLGAQRAVLPPSTIQGIVNVAENAVQLAAQTGAPIGFEVPQNNGIWPNINDLTNAAYRSSAGNWVRLGPTVSLLEAYTSFGDLNHDGRDDAAVIVNKPGADGAPHYFLAAMLNQGGVMFDVAELPLGGAVSINAHHIVNGTIELDNKHYQLFGISLNAL